MTKENNNVNMEEQGCRKKSKIKKRDEEVIRSR